VRYSRRFRVEPGSTVRLRDADAGRTPGAKSKRGAARRMADNLRRLSALQYRLFAERRRAVLIVLQAMDAGGKDGTIRHVMGPINPQSCTVVPFGVPTREELAHDFLWRVHKAVPAAGEIGIFNRSHYEDVLVVRVKKLAPKAVWSKRYRQINDFERLLADSGVCVLKFFLHVSKDEQLERLKARLDDPDKHWKVNPADFDDRGRWDEYVRAYEDVLSRCSTPHAPWFVIPADRKWFRNLAVSQIVVEAMAAMAPQFPPPAFDLSKIEPR
jgi:PPK2 family polyphosphate:nucleotide phosphotransferase